MHQLIKLAVSLHTSCCLPCFLCDFFIRNGILAGIYYVVIICVILIFLSNCQSWNIKCVSCGFGLLILRGGFFVDGRELIIQEHWTYIKIFPINFHLSYKHVFFIYFCREKREEELEYFMTKKYNRLGSKIQTRNTTLSNIVTDPDLLLKWIKLSFWIFSVYTSSVNICAQ